MSYRSKFEKSVAKHLTENKVRFKYETDKIKYVVPESNHTYLIDFKLPNGIIVETKGVMDLATRKKMKLVKEQNPDLDIRFVFQRAQNPIRKGSKTTYATWADKNGFKWAEGTVPTDWLNEKPRRNTKTTP